MCNFQDEHGGLEICHQLSLSNLSLSVPFEDEHQSEFQLESGSKTVRLCARTEKSRNNWYEATFSAIERHRETMSSFPSVTLTGEVEEGSGRLVAGEENVSGLMKPVLFPKELVDRCQVKPLMISSYFSFFLLLGEDLQCKVLVVRSQAAPLQVLRSCDLQVIFIGEEPFQKHIVLHILTIFF